MNKKNYVYFLILTSLCFLVYFNSLKSAFICDDILAIVENPVISQPWRFWLDPSSLLNSLGYLITKTNPFIYHLTNIVLHSINTILVFVFLRLFFKVKPSLLAAGLFAVHPIHTEAVVWISGRPYLVLALFILGVYLLYYTATKSCEVNRKVNIHCYLFCLLIFSYFTIRNIGFFSLTPLLLILSDITFRRWRRNWKLWLPFLGIAIFRLILAKNEIPIRISYVASILRGQKAIWVSPMVNFTFVLSSHLRLLLWPLKLTFYHEPLDPYSVSLNLSIIFLFFLIACLIFMFKKAKELFLGSALFILFLAPVYSPVLLASCLVAERYIYFPSISLSILAAFLYEKWACLESKRMRKTPVFLTMFTVLIGVYGLRTIARNEDWKTPESFWKATLAISYNSPSAHNAQGLIYQQKTDFQRAMGSFKKAIELNPGFVSAYLNLGNVYNDLGKREEAIALFKKAIEINPDYIEPYNNLGNTYSEIGRKEEAISLYKKVIEINPKDRDAYYNLGNTYSEMGRREEAIIYFKKAIEINPTDAHALNNLGIIYLAMERRKEAIGLFKKAIQVNPDYAAAYFNLSKLYFYEKEYDLAVDYCDKAIKLGHRALPEFLKQLAPYRK